jgi:hypothetical protein
MFTSIYGLSTVNLRNNFWNELSNIRTLSNVAWLIGGNFNVIRYRSERKGMIFNHSVSIKFNNFINNNQLIDSRPQGRRFTWSNMRILPSPVCLDRFLCTTSWEREFPNCLNKLLPRYQSS